MSQPCRSHVCGSTKEAERPEPGEQDPEVRSSPREPARDGGRARCDSKVKYNKDETGPLEGKQETTGDLTSVGFREESGLQPDVKDGES